MHLQTVLCALAVLLLAGPAGAQPPPPLVVSVASSLADVMSELARRHEQATGQPVRLNVAGSNFIARQIVEGARADAFVSADETQMDVVERAGRLVPGTRVDLLTNQLVVVGRPAGRCRAVTQRCWRAPASAASRSGIPRASRPASTRAAGSRAAGSGTRSPRRSSRR